MPLSITVEADLHPYTFAYPTCRVVRLIDGDTLDVDVDLGMETHRTPVTLRLLGCNAPEIRTQAGKDALQWVAGVLPPGAPVALMVRKTRAGTDAREKYGRYLATVLYALPGEPEDANLHNLTLDLIAAGHAVAWDGTGPRPE